MPDRADLELRLIKLLLKDGARVVPHIAARQMHERSPVDFSSHKPKGTFSTQSAHCRHSRPRFTSSGARRNSNRSDKDLDWQRVVDHIAAEIWIVSVRLATLVCSHRARQQRITAGLCWHDPIVLPAPPCV